jgi:hypothetical protein
MRYVPLALLLVVAGSACSRSVETVPAPSPPPVGGYVLVHVDGSALPYGVPAGERRPAGLEITGARLVLEVDGTFSQWMSYRFESDGAVRTMEREFAGRWVKDGAEYRMTWEGAGVTPAWVDGDLFTYQNVDMLLTFRRHH